MSATLVDRQPVREYVVVSLATAATAAQAVYDYEPDPVTVAGKSPFVSVSSEGTGQEMASESYNPADMFLRVGVWVRVDTEGGVTRAAAEDLLDELDRQVRQWVRDNAGPTYSGGSKLWDNADFSGRSQCGWWPAQGVWWRREERVLKFHVGALS